MASVARYVQVWQGSVSVLPLLPHQGDLVTCCWRKTELSFSLCPALYFDFVLLCAVLGSSGVQIRHISSFQ